jgi:CRP-like cAMP-binding protein
MGHVLGLGEENVVAARGRPDKLFREALSKAFPSLGADQVAELAAPPLKSRSFIIGETVLRQGAWANAFYVITKGEAEVVQYDARGNERSLDSVLGPGDFFGEIGLLIKPTRTASVRARTALEVVLLDQEQFSDLVKASQPSAETVKKAAKSRLARKPARAGRQKQSRP